MTQYSHGVFLGIVLFLGFFMLPEIHVPGMMHVGVGNIEEDFQEGSMLFVGDIFLGRNVEQLIEAYGPEYPFLNTSTLLESVDVTIGNFEGAIPKVHVPTPSKSFVFSVQKSYLSLLQNTGFDILSLANNHAHDFGDDGLVHTRASCVEFSLNCIGEPYGLSDISSTVTSAGDTQVGILALQAIERNPKHDELEARVNALEGQSEVQIAFVHWGTEYEATHNELQQELAEWLIDAGVDAVVGHHPHVIEPVVFYKDRPIFYSLGNFVFDQYFSEEVQTGLALRFLFQKDQITVTPIPVSSVATKSQPEVLPVDARDVFLQTLVEKDDTLQQHMNGVSFVINRRPNLAVSPH